MTTLNRRQRRIHIVIMNSSPKGHIYVRVTLEFFGVAKIRAEVSQLELEFETDVLTLGEVLLAAGDELPEWAGTCLQDQRLAPGYLANIDGEAFVREPSHLVRHGQTVLIMAADAGG